MYSWLYMYQDCWPYLGFAWGVGLARRWYTFRVLPFGLSTACYVFTKLMRPLVKRWRSLGLRCVVYIDDGICGHISVAKMSGQKVVEVDLKKTERPVNSDKLRAKAHCREQQLYSKLVFPVAKDYPTP